MDLTCIERFFMSVGHFHVVQGEVSIQFFAHFLIGLIGFCVLSCMSSLCTLDSNPLWDVSFASIFSHSVGSLCLVESFLLCAKTF